MMKREPGFMGLAKRNAKKKPMSQEQQQFRQQLGQEMQADRAQEQGMVDKMSAFNRMQQDKQKMVEIPQEYEPSQGGEMESLAYVNPKEMEMLKRAGGSGEMTEYGVPSFGARDENKDHGAKENIFGNTVSSASQRARHEAVRREGTREGSAHQPGAGGGGGGGGGGDASAAALAAERKAFADYKAGEEGRNKAAADAREKEWQTSERKGYMDEYGGYKGEVAGLGKEAKDITGQFGEDATKLGAYQDKFDTMAGTAKGRGDAGEKYFGEQGVKYSDEAGKGAQELKGVGEGYKGITGQGMVDAAAEGQAGFQQGAQDVGAVKGRFGEEGYEKDVGGYESQVAGLADKAMGGDLGQREAGMLRGQMEESRMASQKGSEEKLRRSLAQSGASPSEIAAKVAQFQKSSAGQQAQAGRSEALSSQLQGQQMGQSKLGQAAGLMGQGAGMAGQRAGMAGQQASLGAQQAALRGQGAAMQMQGAQGQQQAQLASLQGQGAMSQAATGMNLQGIQGGANMYGQGMAAGMQGQQQQAQMMGQGMGAVQAASGARGQQMAGLGVQGGMVDQQAGFTQAQLNDVMARQSQAYQEQQTAAAQAANAAANSGGGGGGGGGFLSFLSDIRLKDNIKLLKEGKDGDPNIYSFKYKWDTDTTWSGVMAQELLNTKHADAVELNPEGYYMVDYGKLGIPMTQLSIKEEHGI